MFGLLQALASQLQDFPSEHIAPQHKLTQDMPRRPRNLSKEETLTKPQKLFILRLALLEPLQNPSKTLEGQVRSRAKGKLRGVTKKS